MATISHWYTYIEDFEYSAHDFYTLLEGILKDKEIPDMTTKAKYIGQGGIFSSQRLYFRVKRKEFTFDVCAAPFARGFFFSWWLNEESDFVRLFIRRLPFVGKALDRFLWPMTYYKVDTSLMFQEAVRKSVNSAISEVLQQKGLRQLKRSELEPIAHKLMIQ